MNFKSAKRQLAVLRKALKFEKGELSRAEYKRKRREFLLDKIKRVCPSCGNTVLQSRRWVLKGDQLVCRRCFSMEAKLTEERYTFKGPDLRLARLKKNISQKEMAYRCGWTASYQCMLECNPSNTIRKEALEKIKQALGEDWNKSLS